MKQNNCTGGKMLLSALVMLLLLSVGHMTQATQSPDGQALRPEMIHYLGAFRLPEDGVGDENSFSYSGEALAFSPSGNGGEGSLYLTGHSWHTHVAEITIPAPGQAQQVEDLPQARILQPFHNIRGKLYDRWTLEIPKVGLEVLDDSLYFCWGEHFEEVAERGTHGVRSLDLSAPPSEAVCYLRND